MEWFIFGTLVTIWSVRLLESAHALGFLDKRSQRPSGLPPQARPQPRPRTHPRTRQRTRQRIRGRRVEDWGWREEYPAHLEMGEASINDVNSEQFRRILQMLERRKKKNPVAESVDWKKEGF